MSLQDVYKHGCHVILTPEDSHIRNMLEYCLNRYDIEDCNRFFNTNFAPILEIQNDELFILDLRKIDENNFNFDEFPEPADDEEVENLNLTFELRDVNNNLMHDTRDLKYPEKKSFSSLSSDFWSFCRLTVCLTFAYFCLK